VASKGNLNSDPGNTPLSPDEKADLIPDLSTQEELNEWERQNILEARSWALSERELKRCDPVTEGYIRELHYRMFDQTWKWAGSYRKTEKNLGVPVHQIMNQLGALLGNGKYWIEHQTFDNDEIAVRFHHNLVVIHPFPNGNGRHARLIADVIAMKLHRPAFSWGSADIVHQGLPRESYLGALRIADGGNFNPLVQFSRS
jgi:Fic-DOC domain mobile mystery protein B